MNGFQVTVPGNLLFAGEYSVLEEGGKGITGAINRFVRASAEPADTFEMVGIFGGRRQKLEIDDPLLRAVYFTLHSGQSPDSLNLPYRISIDSSEFHQVSGKKTGLGSSAAVALSLCALFLLMEKREDELCRLPFLALQSHRRFQDGRGSGYDVLTSYHGGTGIFTGGELPVFHRIQLPWLASLALMISESPISTADTLKPYEKWKRRCRIDFLDFVEKANGAVEELIKAQTWEQAKRGLLNAREVGLSIGRAIGIPADLPKKMGSIDDASGVVKALGAGDELFGRFSPQNPPPLSGWDIMKISQTGMTWQKA